MEQVVYGAKVRKYLSREQKLEILREHRELGIPISQLARKNGIHAITIYQWKRQMNDQDDVLTPEKMRELISELSKVKLENKHLKSKVADLSISNEILTDALEIAKKKALLKQLKSLGKSQSLKNIK